MIYFNIEKDNIETKIIEYRQSNDYIKLSLLEKTYLTVELDKIKNNVKEIYKKFINNNIYTPHIIKNHGSSY